MTWKFNPKNKGSSQVHKHMKIENKCTTDRYEKENLTNFYYYFLGQYLANAD